ncbi:hypothetical protein Ancab_031902 [Ancistrocladus abbreviatus]
MEEPKLMRGRTQAHLSQKGSLGQRSVKRVKSRDFELIPFGAGIECVFDCLLALRMFHLMVALLIHFFTWELENGSGSLLWCGRFVVEDNTVVELMLLLDFEACMIVNGGGSLLWCGRFVVEDNTVVELMLLLDFEACMIVNGEVGTTMLLRGLAFLTLEAKLNAFI